MFSDGYHKDIGPDMKQTSLRIRPSIECQLIFLDTLLIDARRINRMYMNCSTLAIGNNSIRQSVGKGLLRADRPPSQDQVEGSRQTDEMRKAHRSSINQGNS